MAKQKGVTLDHEAIYKRVLIARKNKELFKAANSMAKEKYSPKGYRDVAKEFHCTPQLVGTIVKKFERDNLLLDTTVN